MIAVSPAPTFAPLAIGLTHHSTGAARKAAQAAHFHVGHRKVFTSLEKAFGVKFMFADGKIIHMHIMQEIISHIQAADFSIYELWEGLSK
jgi:hypothetical protein